MPFGMGLTIWILLKKIKAPDFRNYIIMGAVWVLMAIILDYFLLIKVFNPPDGYYKLDVYIYYALTFLLPLLVGLRFTKERSKRI